MMACRVRRYEMDWFGAAGPSATPGNYQFAQGLADHPCQYQDSWRGVRRCL